MALYTILSKRGCINILKILYDQEVVDKKGYTTNLSDVKSKLGINFDLLSEIKELNSEDLITSEEVDNDHILSITEKGKKFIEVFDDLVKLMEGDFKEKRKEKKPSIEYDLSDFEKRLLLFVHKIAKEKGQGITIKELTEELYPYQEVESKKKSVAKHIKKLVELNLLKKTKEGRKNFIEISQTGLRVVKEQYLKTLI